MAAELVVYAVRPGELAEGEATVAAFSGHNGGVEHMAFEIEHTGAGAGVRMQGDCPLDWFFFWTNYRCISPEPYIKIHVEPGHEQAWTYNYEFYTLD